MLVLAESRESAGLTFPVSLLGDPTDSKESAGLTFSVSLFGNQMLNVSSDIAHFFLGTVSFR